MNSSLSTNAAQLSHPTRPLTERDRNLMQTASRMIMTRACINVDIDNNLSMRVTSKAINIPVTAHISFHMPIWTFLGPRDVGYVHRIFVLHRLCRRVRWPQMSPSPMSAAMGKGSVLAVHEPHESVDQNVMSSCPSTRVLVILGL